MIDISAYKDWGSSPPRCEASSSRRESSASSGLPAVGRVRPWCVAGIESLMTGISPSGRGPSFDRKQGIDVPVARQRRVGYLFQHYALFPNMTVEENIPLCPKGLD